MASLANKSSNLIDSKQILLVCSKIKANLSLLDRTIKKVQLRLTTLNYVKPTGSDLNSYKNSNLDDLIELSNLSESMATLLDELRSKLSDSAECSIDYEIASQQLMYFTSEWFENILPKLNETFKMANLNREEQLENYRSRTNNKDADYYTNVDSALLRLKQSIHENERLITTIANNVEYTRATIEAIHDSLQATKVNLQTNETNTREAIDLLKETNRCKVITYAIVSIILIVVTIIVVQLIFGLFSS